MDWNVENYQFVYFHQPHLVEDAFQVWLALFQTPPDNYQKHPDLNTRSTHASGNFAGYTFQVTSTLGRIDFFLMGAEHSADLALPSLPVVKNDKPALELLVSKVKAYPSSGLGVVRLAFVTQLNYACDNAQAAAAIIASVVQPKTLPENSTELSFSLNVRKQSKIADFTLNRLCRWQSGELQFVHMQIGRQGNPTPISVMLPVATLNIDVNTVPKQNAIKDADLAALIDEVVEEGLLIRNGGIDALVA